MHALDGVTVLSLEQAVAAPLATRHLADLGARVIKVERPDEGDFARGYDGAVRGMASHFVWLNRGKESVALDLKSERGREALTTLLGGADVFLQNLAPGAVARLGFGADELMACHPELVTVDMSGYGSSGPYHDKRAYDLLIQGETGLASVTGTPGSPAKTGIPIADIGAGMYAFSAVLAALLRRARGGGGARIEVSMFDAVAEWMGHPLHTTKYTGTPPARSALGHPSIVPYDAYPTADGPDLLIGVQNDRQWRKLARDVLGRPDLAEHPEFATNLARCRNRATVDATVAEATRTLRTEPLVRQLDEAGIGNAALNSVHGLVDHPQLAARDRWRTVETPAGPVESVLPPITFGDVEARMGPVPALGEHTRAVLAEFGAGDGEER
ncbi:CaiB/BaiF CoA transferase family protein [Streptomyces sulphureus]|uniref:CaiB/BaiF CoA transferase family protein n=1 Tax=Streptomyces sulphureus TaxID=47758 RepID=UPI0003696F22|nr:CaiB/BaiF CoA-transferase family protein [Streptomyces sulphureus]